MNWLEKQKVVCDMRPVDSCSVCRRWNTARCKNDDRERGARRRHGSWGFRGYSSTPLRKVAGCFHMLSLKTRLNIEVEILILQCMKIFNHCQIINWVDNCLRVLNGSIAERMHMTVSVQFLQRRATLVSESPTTHAVVVGQDTLAASVA